LKLLYKFFLLIYPIGVRLVSIWNPKAASWIGGRKNLFQLLRRDFPVGTKKIVWMHCASLGEFEQGKPVLQKLTEKYTGFRIVVTFFSPSGYQNARKDPAFEHVYYLPMDSPSNAKKLLDILQPEVIFWVKYEYWHYYLQEIKQRNIPLVLISGVFHQRQIFFKWYGGFYRRMLQCFSHFFVQNNSSAANLKALIPEEKITVSGDTRCDRVIYIAEHFTEVPGIDRFCGNSQVIVAGSTWEDDEAEWTHFVKTHPEIRFIVAPHEIDEENLLDVKKEFAGAVFYSEWVQNLETAVAGSTSARKDMGTHCLIIDNIGMLSRLYRYATVTYVGGGFGFDGLHNVLEAAVYGKPVIFGPEYDKNFEAQELIDCSGAISVENALELEQILNSLLPRESEIRARGLAARDYVYNNSGASEKILQFIQKNRLLTN